MQVTLVSEAAREGNLILLKWMFDKGLTEADLRERTMSATFSEGWQNFETPGWQNFETPNCSPLWYACKSGNLEVRDSMQLAASLVNSLILSCLIIQVVEWLVVHGNYLELSEIHTPNKKGETPFWVAATSGHLPVSSGLKEQC